VALGDRDEVLTEQLTALSMVASPRKQRKDLEASFLVGTPDELDKRLTEYASIGVQHLASRFHGEASGWPCRTGRKVL